jgi:hypothetical protein
MAALLLARALLEFATSVARPAAGAPAVNDRGTLMLLAPNVALMFSFCAKVELKDPAKAPDAFVLPATLVNVLLDPSAEKVMG